MAKKLRERLKEAGLSRIGYGWELQNGVSTLYKLQFQTAEGHENAAAKAVKRIPGLNAVSSHKGQGVVYVLATTRKMEQNLRKIVKDEKRRKQVLAGKADPHARRLLSLCRKIVPRIYGERVTDFDKLPSLVHLVHLASPNANTKSLFQMARKINSDPVLKEHLKAKANVKAKILTLTHHSTIGEDILRNLERKFNANHRAAHLEKMPGKRTA